MVKAIMAASVVFALSLATGAALGQTPAAQQAPDTYMWHGELVSIDETARAITVKAHVLEQAGKAVASFTAGDQVALSWSGMDRFAGSVRQIDRAGTSKEPMTLPAELVSPEVQNGLITVKVQVPQIPAAVKTLKPGEWVTVTARRSPANAAQAIVDLKPYVNSTPLPVATTS